MAASSGEREHLVFMAKLAEEALRYEEMAEWMKKVAYLNVELTREERKLLAAAFKNAMEPRRHSLRVLAGSSISEKDQAMEECAAEDSSSTTGNDRAKKKMTMIRDEYWMNVESDHSNFCVDVLAVIDHHLLPFSSADLESAVFYNKLKGDYYRYTAEFKSGDEKKEVADKSLKAYQVATNIAEKEMSPTDPLRLGLAMNLSVYYYEIMNSPERAYDIANKAFHGARNVINGSEEEPGKGTTLAMKLLWDNISYWASQHPGIQH